MRRPILPSEIADDEKELVTTAGWAAYSALAGRHEEVVDTESDLCAISLGIDLHFQVVT